MVTQKLISFKCDSDQLASFDDLCDGLGVKRNKMLNFLVAYANFTLSDPYKLNIMRAYSSVCFSED